MDTLYFTSSPIAGVICKTQVHKVKVSELSFMGGVFIYLRGHHSIGCTLHGLTMDDTNPCVCAKQLMR